MIIHNGLEEIPKIENLVLTIGTFDGVHKGHQALLESIIARAKELEGQTGLLTFHPHPRTVIRKNGSTIKLLTPIEEKIKLLEQVGLSHLFIVPFSLDFANQPAEEYVKSILLEKIGAKHLIIGYDHKFGRNREGDISLLQKMSSEFDFTVEQISRKEIDAITYSSSNVRNYLDEGNVKEAAKLLGYTYSVEGIVVHGYKRGRDLGYPTANIQVEPSEKLIPKKGVYAVITEFDGIKYSGMLNIGTRPTFDGKSKTIENVLFGFTGDLYGHRIKTSFIDKIRDEKKFSSLSDLQKKLQEDEKAAKRIIERYSTTEGN